MVSCFRAYDIRGEVGVNIDYKMCYKIGQAFAQTLKLKNVIVGYDARESSPEFAKAISNGLMSVGADVWEIGLSGTEEMYWATNEFNACGGIEITGSHNSIEQNGVKMVKAGARPLNPQSELDSIRKQVEQNRFFENPTIGIRRDISKRARAAYVKKILSLIDISNIRPLKIVVNCGNGAAGPTFDAILRAIDKKKGSVLEFIRINHNPDHTFPNGIPNPLLKKNRKQIADSIVASKANLGIAFDGDFDRCFFFDEEGKFLEGQYIAGLLAGMYLDKEANASIVHDPRVVWNIQDIIAAHSGKAIQCKIGHVFFKQIMREVDALYGAESSCHHYFRDFAYCDSGMIPWLLVIELMGITGKPISELLAHRIEAYPSSGEINFKVSNSKKAFDKVISIFKQKAISIDTTDGISMVFSNWRFNLRTSSTENLVRLNIETNLDFKLVQKKLDEIRLLLVE